ncbi:MAG TPA: CxxxxCH/CxxCH domain-containing protein [Anaeromyxobacteraceae bacterium]|nr:CxxxxCH/CxxCH domain-containing protein [Anaeromyxobacteraceae bacterium]
MRNATVLPTLSALAAFGLACGTAQPATSGGGGGGGACTSCHGNASLKPNFPQGSDTYLTYVTAAPPAPPAGRPDAVVGAHQAHVNPSPTASPPPLAGPLLCDNCHNPFPPPNSHVNAPADSPSIIVFGALAFGPANTTDGFNPGTPTWNGVNTSTGITTPTCSAVYCHGSFEWYGNGEGGLNVKGNQSNAPDWDGSNQAACGSCHALPPTNHIQSPHIVPGDATTCAGCHPSTVATNGTIIVDPQTGASAHVNGEIDEGAHPDPDWCVLSSTFGQNAGCAPSSASNPQGGDHMAQALNYTTSQGLTACLSCHSKGGVDFDTADGTPQSSCNACHADVLTGAATPNWQQNCVFCHGNQSLLTTWARPATSTDPSWANVAPPVPPLGGAATTALAVGAHQQHVGALNTLSQPIACWQCHPTYPGPDGMPVDLSHVNAAGPQVPLTGALATTGSVKGTWNSPTCSSTYCHGNFPPTGTGTGGNNATPNWTTVNGTYASCTSCHGSVTVGGVLTPAPNDGQHSFHLTVVGAACSDCHSGYSWDSSSPSTTQVNINLHVNGVRDAGGTTSITSWNPVTLQCTASCHSSNPQTW